MNKGKESEFDQEKVRDLSEAVYRDLLDRDCGKDTVKEMIEKDGDNGEKLRERSGSYDRLSRTYMRAMSK